MSLSAAARGAVPRGLEVGADRPARLVETVSEISALVDEARGRGATIGLVPTMGALHEGHLSLVSAARAECDVVVVTVFVNPLQFDDPADLDTYPRQLGRDIDLAGSAGGQLVFAPSLDEMYAEGARTTVRVSGLSDVLEGRSRPGHLDGVATVVTKLFSIVGRCRAYFGEKDYQQLVLVRRLAADLSLPVTVIGCPTVREPDGLAASSRNARLGPHQRVAATALYGALVAGRRAIEEGERDARAVTRAMAATVRAEPLAALDYAEVVDARSLQVPTPLAGDLRLLIAAQLGDVRLIDNLGVSCN